jgi:uncharacterized OB-fold protein
MSDSSTAAEEGLSAPHTLEYSYKRSLGAVLGRFFTSLRDRKIEGVKTAQGKVLIPPAEYDPESGAPTTGDFVEVGPGGIVTSWAWVSEPRASHPHDHPFAFALIQLDGADTALLHTVETDEAAMSSGMRVQAKWADETVGRIQDITSFIPEASS